MRKIDVKALRPGQRFSMPVFIEDDNVLVPAGVPIRKKDLARLLSWGIDEVETDGELLPPETTQEAVVPGDVQVAPTAPATAVPTPAAPTAPAQEKRTHRAALASDTLTVNEKQVAATVLSLAEVHENKGVYRSYTGFIDKLDEIFEQISGGTKIETRAIDDIASELLQALKDERDNFIRFILGGEISGCEMAKSSVNSAILSALTARELALRNNEILQLITGALLHDVGMYRLPEKLVNKRGKLSEAEMQLMKNHPTYSQKIITKELLYSEDVGLIAFQHHERWDGDGYPRQISGEAICMGARIVSAADAFEAMVSKKSYRNPIMGYQAVKNLLSDNSRRFDPGVLKALIKTMGIYPIGSIVFLNNGALARVIETHGDAPLRPKIVILVDEFGKVSGKGENEVDLLIEKGLFIAKAVDPKELAR